MTARSRPIREMYERYLQGEISFDELKRRTDERTDQYVLERRRLGAQAAPIEQEHSS